MSVFSKISRISRKIKFVPLHTINENIRRNSGLSSTSILSVLPTSQEGEIEFFQLLVLSNIMNTPFFMQGSLPEMDIKEMYKCAKSENCEFHQFIEWVDNHLRKNVHSQMDNYFDENECVW